MAGLRRVTLACELRQELKWRNPFYTFQNGNIVLIHAFKDYGALLFFKGALLKDPEGILIRQTETSQSARQLRFTGVEQVGVLESAVKA